MSASPTETPDGEASAAPLTVLHVRNTDRHGGPERLIVDQARFSPPDVHHILAAFVTEGQESDFLAAAREAGLATREIPQRSSYDRGMLGVLRALVDELQPDVVVSHDYKANWVVKKALRGNDASPACVAVVHGYTREDFKIRVFEWLDRRGLKHFDHVLVVSDVLKQQVTRAGVPRTRLTRVRNSVDVASVLEAARQGRAAVREELGLSPEAEVLLFLGRLSPEKAPENLLEAFTHLAPRHPMLHLLVVGDGVLSGLLANRVRAEGLDERVTFAGWRTDPAACLGAADILVLPSHTEGLPVALLEAMSARTAVVATAVGEIPRVLDEGSLGWMVPPGDAVALEAALMAALGDPDERLLRVEAAHQRVREEYGAQAGADRLAALYRQVVKART